MKSYMHHNQHYCHMIRLQASRGTTYNAYMCPQYKAKFAVKLNFSGLPWWRSGWESACQCRGHGFKPWSGKIPHAAEQLGP